MQKKTFRFIFSDSINTLLETFSKTHTHTDRKTFKQEWQKWTQENITQIQEEINRIESNGYKGDVLQKMFTSARYYYRKKIIQQKPHPSPIIKRKPYQSISKTIVFHMENHIREQIQQGIPPAISFHNYGMQINTLLKNYVENPETIIQKLKKYYKNKYQVASK